MFLGLPNMADAFLYPKVHDMTNILIPTDFTPASLQMAEQAVQTLDLKNANIVLFHAFELPDSEYELLTQKQKPYASVVTDNFRQACKQFKDQHAKAIHKICFKFMEGNTPALFRNFIDVNEIDLIVCPDHYQFVPVNKKSVDPRPLFKKSGIKVIREFSSRRKEGSYENNGMSMQVAFASN